MKTKEDFLAGQILLIDKPLGWSSFQAVNSVKWSIRKKFDLKKIKVGHAGTLDPLATGLLIICTGKATKKIQDIQALPKEYVGYMVLGATTPSFDLETEITHHSDTVDITEERLTKATEKFTGIISQLPPVYSAVRKDGKRLYEYAREGKAVEIKSREVEIQSFDLMSVKLPEIKFLVRCSKGTYIRSLANDYGQELGCGAYLSALRRTKTGDFNVDNALSPDKFREWINQL